MGSNPTRRTLKLDGCSLGDDALAAQGARWRSLGEHVAGSERAPGELVIRFDASVDRALLEQTLAIERSCCPFFELALDGNRLSVRVSDEEHLPALDAVAAGLGLDQAGWGSRPSYSSSSS